MRKGAAPIALILGVIFLVAVSAFIGQRVFEAKKHFTEEISEQQRTVLSERPGVFGICHSLKLQRSFLPSTIEEMNLPEALKQFEENSFNCDSTNYFQCFKVCDIVEKVWNGCSNYCPSVVECPNEVMERVGEEYRNEGEFPSEGELLRYIFDACKVSYCLVTRGETEVPYLVGTCIPGVGLCYGGDGRTIIEDPDKNGLEAIPGWYSLSEEEQKYWASKACRCILAGESLPYSFDDPADPWKWEEGGWNGTGNYCCGDDPEEFFLYRSGFLYNPQDVACCDKSTDCVYYGKCYNDGERITTEDGEEFVCKDGKWAPTDAWVRCGTLSEIAGGDDTCGLSADIKEFLGALNEQISGKKVTKMKFMAIPVPLLQNSWEYISKLESSISNPMPEKCVRYLRQNGGPGIDDCIINDGQYNLCSSFPIDTEHDKELTIPYSPWEVTFLPSCIASVHLNLLDIGTRLVFAYSTVDKPTSFKFVEFKENHYEVDLKDLKDSLQSGYARLRIWKQNEVVDAEAEEHFKTFKPASADSSGSAGSLEADSNLYSSIALTSRFNKLWCGEWLAPDSASLFLANYGGGALQSYGSSITMKRISDPYFCLMAVPSASYTVGSVDVLVSSLFRIVSDTELYASHNDFGYYPFIGEMQNIKYSDIFKELLNKMPPSLLISLNPKLPNVAFSGLQISIPFSRFSTVRRVRNVRYGDFVNVYPSGSISYPPSPKSGSFLGNNPELLQGWVCFSRKFYRTNVITPAEATNGMCANQWCNGMAEKPGPVYYALNLHEEPEWSFKDVLENFFESLAPDEQIDWRSLKLCFGKRGVTSSKINVYCPPAGSECQHGFAIYFQGKNCIEIPDNLEVEVPYLFAKEDCSTKQCTLDDIALNYVEIEDRKTTETFGYICEECSFRLPATREGLDSGFYTVSCSSCYTRGRGGDSIYDRKLERYKRITQLLCNCMYISQFESSWKPLLCDVCIYNSECDGGGGLFENCGSITDPSFGFLEFTYYGGRDTRLTPSGSGWLIGDTSKIAEVFSGLENTNYRLTIGLPQFSELMFSESQGSEGSGEEQGINGYWRILRAYDIETFPYISEKVKNKLEELTGSGTGVEWAVAVVGDFLKPDGSKFSGLMIFSLREADYLYQKKETANFLGNHSLPRVVALYAGIPYLDYFSLGDEVSGIEALSFENWGEDNIDSPFPTTANTFVADPTTENRPYQPNLGSYGVVLARIEMDPRDVKDASLAVFPMEIGGLPQEVILLGHRDRVDAYAFPLFVKYKDGREAASLGDISLLSLDISKILGGEKDASNYRITGLAVIPTFGRFSTIKQLSVADNDAQNIPLVLLLPKGFKESIAGGSDKSAVAKVLVELNKHISKIGITKPEGLENPEGAYEEELGNTIYFKSPLIFWKKFLNMGKGVYFTECRIVYPPGGRTNVVEPYISCEDLSGDMKILIGYGSSSSTNALLTKKAVICYPAGKEVCSSPSTTEELSPLHYMCVGAARDGGSSTLDDVINFLKERGCGGTETFDAIIFSHVNDAIFYDSTPGAILLVSLEDTTSGSMKIEVLRLGRFANEVFVNFKGFNIMSIDSG